MKAGKLARPFPESLSLVVPGIQALTIAVTLATTIALLARGAGALNNSGALPAAAAGTGAMVPGGGWEAVLVADFVGSSRLWRSGPAGKGLPTAQGVHK